MTLSTETNLCFKLSQSKFINFIYSFFVENETFYLNTPELFTFFATSLKTSTLRCFKVIKLIAIICNFISFYILKFISHFVYFSICLFLSFCVMTTTISKSSVIQEKLCFFATSIHHSHSHLHVLCPQSCFLTYYLFAIQ